MTLCAIATTTPSSSAPARGRRRSARARSCPREDLGHARQRLCADHRHGGFSRPRSCRARSGAARSAARTGQPLAQRGEIRARVDVQQAARLGAQGGRGSPRRLPGALSLAAVRSEARLDRGRRSEQQPVGARAVAVRDDHHLRPGGGTAEQQPELPRGPVPGSPPARTAPCSSPAPRPGRCPARRRRTGPARAGVLKQEPLRLSRAAAAIESSLVTTIVSSMAGVRASAVEHVRDHRAGRALALRPSSMLSPSRCLASVKRLTGSTAAVRMPLVPARGCGRRT